MNRVPRLRVGAAIAIAIAIGVGAWLLVQSRDDDSTATTTPTLPESTNETTTAQPTGPVIVSADGLATLVKAIGHPVYWAGSQPSRSYELTELTNGRIYVRYLPDGVKAGDKRPYLTVATYQFPKALAATTRASKQPDTVVLDPGNGGVAFYKRGFNKNVHLAFPGSDIQIEVFGPRPAQVARLVRSGQIVPVE